MLPRGYTNQIFFSSEITLSKDFILTLKIVVQTRGKFVLRGGFCCWFGIMCASVQAHSSQWECIWAVAESTGGEQDVGNGTGYSAQLAHINNQGFLLAVWTPWQKPSCFTILQWNYNQIVVVSWTHLCTKNIWMLFILRILGPQAASFSVLCIFFNSCIGFASLYFAGTFFLVCFLSQFPEQISPVFFPFLYFGG